MNWTMFFVALAMVESTNDPTKVGDQHLEHKAYGLYQIRQPYIDDVNEMFGSRYRTEHALNKRMAERIVFLYMRRYTPAYTAVTGKPLNWEAAARMHNGGPTGWDKDSTLPHWIKMKRELMKEIDPWTNQPVN